MTNNPPAFERREWQSEDGLTLSARDYAGGGPDRPPLLCLHGLTRNSRDFETVAGRYAGNWRVIVPDMRGRGKSEYSRDSSSYEIGRYVDDVVRLLDELKTGPVAVIGTSMGGLMAMMIAASRAWPLAGTVLNDIGPDLEPAGLARIREYVGQARSYETWMHAARALRETAAGAHPDFELADWLAMAKRNMCLSGSGRIAYDYDMKIAEPFAAADGAAPPNLWPAFRALAGKPLLILRGELSDLLATTTVEAMVAEVPGAKGVTVPHVGHAPLLSEPAAVAAIDDWLAEIA